MTTKSEDLVRNNHNVTLAEYVWTRAKELLVKWEWIGASDPIPTSIPMHPVHDMLAALRAQFGDPPAAKTE